MDRKALLAVVLRVPGYQVPFAECIEHDAGIPTIAVSLITITEAPSYAAPARASAPALSARHQSGPAIAKLLVADARCLVSVSEE
ncbi:hypothetical protein [Pseudorhodoplanes sinuspersici]|uniref:Uncharacterized protein n=1 Tax=Pseudorhodoplanes sinuspersici TaxID=1235591 RepID=A0A1W6ZM62_9HYPH|nr:hypothetical protein [Pseudorhodoplanes sinuspersici]ARP98439.1 hypothetical protein CAK95_04530 [Pseudorhodoplanes sinuspersici]